MSVITIISLIVLAVCIGFGIYRGFLRALLKFIFAIATCILTFTITPYLAKAMYSNAVENGRNISAGVCSGLSALVLLVICALVFGLITFIAHKSISKSPLNSANRLLGALFYLFLGFSVLILVGYVLHIMSDLSFMQPVVQNAEKDPFATWLITNNLFSKFLELMAKNGGVFQDFLNGFKSLGSQDTPSGEETARIAAAIGLLI